MKKITNFLLAFTLIATPVVLTSCDDGDDYEYYYNDLVTEAVHAYYHFYPNGTDYYTAYNWFLTNYPNAYAAELDAFMAAVEKGNSSGEQDPLLTQAQFLTGEWEGDMVYEFDDASTGKRVQQKYIANMKFYQYYSSGNALSGNGTEVDTADDGSTQTLDFKWRIDKTGDIYITYTRSGTTFRMDASSKDRGFFLGYDKDKRFDVFYGYALSTNTTDAFYIDLDRLGTNNVKVNRIVANKALKSINGTSFGQATINKIDEYKAKAVSGLKAR